MIDRKGSTRGARAARNIDQMAGRGKHSSSTNRTTLELAEASKSGEDLMCLKSEKILYTWDGKFKGHTVIYGLLCPSDRNRKPRLWNAIVVAKEGHADWKGRA